MRWMTILSEQDRKYI